MVGVGKIGIGAESGVERVWVARMRMRVVSLPLCCKVLLGAPGLEIVPHL